MRNRREWKKGIRNKGMKGRGTAWNDGGKGNDRGRDIAVHDRLGGEVWVVKKRTYMQNTLKKKSGMSVVTVPVRATSGALLTTSRASRGDPKESISMLPIIHEESAPSRGDPKTKA